MALAGTRALWAARGFGNSEYLTMWYGSTLAGSGHALFYGVRDSLSGGVQYRGIAGSGQTLVYAAVDWKEPTPLCPDYERNGGYCAPVAAPSPLRRVEGAGKIVPIPGSKVGDALAAHGSTVAASYGSRIKVR